MVAGMPMMMHSLTPTDTQTYGQGEAREWSMQLLLIGGSEVDVR